MDLLVYDPQLKATWLGRMEVRVKILTFVTLVVIFASLKSLSVLALALSLLLALALLSAVSLRVLLKRILWLIPFAGMMIMFFPFITPGEAIFSWHLPLFTLTATAEGFDKAGFLALRVINATLAISLLVLTTPLSELLHGFKQLRVPAIMVNLIAFTLRYFQVVSEEIQRMRLAMRARGFKTGKHLFDFHTMKTLGLLLGTLFLRAAERGDRIYFAMLSRGYRGEVSCCGHCTPRFTDWVTGLSVITLGLSLKIIDWRGFGLWHL